MQWIFLLLYYHYSNLDLESCLWEFEAYFKLSELINICGAQVETDGQVSLKPSQECLLTRAVTQSDTCHIISPLISLMTQGCDMKWCGSQVSWLSKEFSLDTIIPFLPALSIIAAIIGGLNTCKSHASNTCVKSWYNYRGLVGVANQWPYIKGSKRTILTQICVACFKTAAKCEGAAVAQCVWIETRVRISEKSMVVTGRSFDLNVVDLLSMQYLLLWPWHFFFWQVRDLTKSYVSLVIPLYVSYVFHSPTAPGGWLHYDLSNKLRVTFVYDTALLLRQGVKNIQSDASNR